jgi:TPR repeat protein
MLHMLARIMGIGIETADMLVYGSLYKRGRGGLPNDDGEAARLYKLAADQENARAQCNLGFLYEDGRGGLPKTDCEAARLYKLAADQGNARAQSYLASFLSKGRGGLLKDDATAVTRYRKAADQGDAGRSTLLGSSTYSLSLTDQPIEACLAGTHIWHRARRRDRRRRSPAASVPNWRPPE